MRWLIFLSVPALFLAAAFLIPCDHDLSRLVRTSPAIQHNAALFEFLRVFKVFGRGNILFLLALTLGTIGLRRIAVEIIIALVISALLVWPVKMTVQRERPNKRNHLSFPSADTAAAAAASVPLAYRSFKILPVAGGVVLIVAASRVLYGYHYPADVCAGLGLGLLAGFLGVLVKRRWPWTPSWKGFLFAALIFYAGHIGIGLFGYEGDLSGNAVLNYLKFFGLVLLLIFAARFVPVCFRANKSRFMANRQAGEKAVCND